METSDDGSVYEESCEEWQEVSDSFHKQEDWPPGWDDLNKKRNSHKLRAFWERHGCVQCWFETLVQLPHHRPNYSRRKRRVYVNNPGVSTDWLRARIKNWNKPDSRIKGRYHCKKHSKELAWAVGILGVAGIGHLAWAYQVPQAWRDHKKFSPWLMGEHALWSADEDYRPINGSHEEGVDGLDDAFIGAGYNEYKTAKAPYANFEEAFLRAMEVIETWGYSLPTRNCQAAVHYVLTGFDTLGLPEDYIFAEIEYYARVEGEIHEITAIPTEVPHPRPAPRPRSPGKTPRPRPLKATATTSADVDGRDFKAAYVANGSDVAHLVEDCPALTATVAPATPIRLKAASTIDEAEAELETPICGTCRRMHDARSRLAVFEGKGAGVTLFNDRLMAAFEGGMFSEERQIELTWPEIQRADLRLPTLTSRSYSVLLRYKLRGDWIPSQLEIPFSDECSARQCQSAIVARLDEAHRVG